MKRRLAQPISNGIATALKELGLSHRLRELSVLDVWEEVVGEQIARIAVAERISGGNLVVRVSTAAWRNELAFLRKNLIEKLNRATNDKIVRNILFR